jgi:hypothetical protein
MLMKILHIFCIALGATLAVMSSARGQKATVDLQLVLNIDVSSSVNYDEFDLQMRGYVAAFESAEVKDAITSGVFGHIRVSLIQWAGNDQQQVSLDWTDIRTSADAEAFARQIEFTPRAYDFGGTAIAPALKLALLQFKKDTVIATRQIIDLSGDGRVSMGPEPQEMRDQIINAGIIINGLPILNEEPGLSDYYRSNIIGGSGSFVEAAKDYKDFTRAITEKLAREIRGEFIGM